MNNSSKEERKETIEKALYFELSDKEREEIVRKAAEEGAKMKRKLIKQIKIWTNGRNVTKESLRAYLNKLKNGKKD